MAINTIELATKMTGDLDKAVVHKAVTGFFNDNAFGAKFYGAKTVSVPEMDMDGLADYDRDAGYTKGGATLNYEEYQMTMDRGRTFQLDAQDADESGVAGLAGKLSAEFLRTKVIPEVDAYVLSKLGAYADTEGQLVSGTPASEIYKIFVEAQNNIGSALDYDQDLVCLVNPAVNAYLASTTEITRQLVVSDFKQGEINLKVKSLNGVPIIPVPDNRMYTAYTFSDNGFAKTGEAKHIGMLMLPKAACMLVKKTDDVRIFDPKTTQHANAWKIDYRIYYDAFIKRSLRTGIFAYTYAQ